MLSDLHVLGDYWEPAADRRTPLGRLVRVAKDEGDPEARGTLGRRLGAAAAELDLPVDTLVVAVPPAPGRSAHPVPALADAVAAATGLERSEALVRHRATPPLRDRDPVDRPALVGAAGYEVVDAVTGRTVLLVDDVVLTATTLEHLAGLLTAAGACRVEAIVACRTRRVA